MDHFTEDGVWWLPEDPNRTIPGTLTFDDAGVSVALQRSLWPAKSDEDGASNQFNEQSRHASVVHGRTRSGQDVTLYEVDGFVTLLTAKRGVVGGHMPDDSFDEIWFDLDNLEHWWRPPPIATDKANGYALDIEQIELGSVRLETANLRVVADCLGVVADDSVELRRYVSICATADQPASLNTLLKSYVHPMQDLLLLCLGVPTRVVDVRVTLRTRRGGPGKVILKLASRQPHLLTRASMISDTSPCVYKVGDQLIAPDALIARWFELWPSLKRTVGFLHGPLRAPFMFQESSFLFAFLAAEAVFSALHDSNEMSPEGHAKRVEALREALACTQLSLEIRARAERLFDRNDKTQKAKINELASYGGVDELLTNDRGAFGRVASRLRSRVAHPGGPGDVTLRHWTAELLRWTVRLRILAHVTQDQSAVRNLAATNQAIAYIVEQFEVANGSA